MRVGLLRRQFQSDPLRPSARGRGGSRSARAGPGLFHPGRIAAAQVRRRAGARRSIGCDGAAGDQGQSPLHGFRRRDSARRTLLHDRHGAPFSDTPCAQPSTLFLMMGSDSFAELDTWKDCDELVRLCIIVVHTRPSDGDGQPPRISLAALKRFGYIREDDHYVHPSGQTLSFVATTFFPISATLIRDKASSPRIDPLPDARRRGRLYSAARAVLTAPVFSHKSFNKTIRSLSAAARRLAVSSCSA